MNTYVSERIVPVKLMSQLWTEVGIGYRIEPMSLPTRPTPDEATFGMVDEMVKHAIQDATQTGDLPLRWEALAWLWVCCPDIADQLLMPWPKAVDVQQKAAAYLDRYPSL